MSFSTILAISSFGCTKLSCIREVIFVDFPLSINPNGGYACEWLPLLETSSVFSLESILFSFSLTLLQFDFQQGKTRQSGLPLRVGTLYLVIFFSWINSLLRFTNERLISPRFPSETFFFSKFFSGRFIFSKIFSWECFSFFAFFSWRN